MPDCAAAGAYKVPMVEPWEKCKCQSYLWDSVKIIIYSEIVVN